MRGRKTGGRRKGTPNKVTAEAKAVCAALLDDPTYRTNLTARAWAWWSELPNFMRIGPEDLAMFPS